MKKHFQIFLGELSKMFTKHLSASRKIWKPAASKTKKQDTTLNKYLISLIIFYIRLNKKSLYIFTLQIIYLFCMKLRFFSPLSCFNHFVCLMNSLRPLTTLLWYTNHGQSRCVHHLKNIWWLFY